MTSNEKVKQAINKNMASIYSALEQVGATLPEKKNLENISTSIESLIEKENIKIIKCLDLFNNKTNNVDSYIKANRYFQELAQIHLYGGQNG